MHDLSVATLKLLSDNANMMGDGEQLIHSPETLPAVQKLQYLNAFYVENHEKLIRNYGLTKENFESAGKLWNERYNNKRELIISHQRARII